MSIATIVLASRGPAQVGGERDKPAQNLPSSPSSSVFIVSQAGGMGHILSWGVRKRSEPITGGAYFPELSCYVSF